MLTEQFQSDREWIEGKYHDPQKPFDAYHRMQYHGHPADPETGLDDAGIAEGLQKLAPSLEGLPHPIAKAKAIGYVLENMQITFPKEDYFPLLGSWNRAASTITLQPWSEYYFKNIIPETARLMAELNRTGEAAIWPDYDHVVPDWHGLLSLGFTGMKKRAEEAKKSILEKGELTPKKGAFLEGMILEWEGVLSFIRRLYDYVAEKDDEKAAMQRASMEHLLSGPPRDFYDALQVMYLYFMISESVDNYQVRSLGNGFDHSLMPFYEKALSEKRYTREEMGNLLAYFLMQFSAIGNYWGQPLYLGGTEPDGTTRVNEMTWLFLEVYDELGIYNPKIQIKVDVSTPKDFLYKIYDMVRKGHSSFVFCCEPGLKKAIMNYGATAEEAADFDIRGCYETGVRANEVSASSGYVNMLQTVLRVMKKYEDRLQTFDEFLEMYLAEVTTTIDRCMACTNSYEKYFDEINPSMLYSSTIENTVRNGLDGYAYGVKFNNSALLCCGIGTAIDALEAIKKFVYEDKLLSVTAFTRILDKNWEGEEGLRRKALNLREKYGSGHKEARALAARVADYFTAYVDGKANARGGVYKAICHTAMQFAWQGKKTGASPDGRLNGEEFSKNASPTVGMDKNGVTALITDALSLHPDRFTESFCVDCMLHPSAVQGEDGLKAMDALVMAYLLGGGQSIQFNIVLPETLKDAQKHPEQYKNLQIRVCGWNVLWNNIPLPEQNAYIARAEGVSGY